MDYKHLSKRLHRAGEFVPEGSKLADIGSDHAYLPAYLVMNKKIISAIAGEVVEGPYQSAKNLVAELNLSSVIDVRKGDGLAVVDPKDDVTAVSICGMGGALIRDILDRGLKGNHLTGKETLILQPNIGEPTLRTWLVNHSYHIIQEDIIRENEKTYEIIVAEKVSEKVALSEKELLFGPLLLKQQGDVFLDKWQHELKQFHNILTQLEKSTKDVSDKIAEVEQKIEFVKEVLA
ncbi:tRNA (adenine(22)-N(1))-methyltransferase [Vagococcus fluvialis]|uniref:tRNA (adenine(22)-N(1))-methyltransferase n=1 Tax=Vagococcus fluvialis TaxID=2738 RepID=UPI003B5B3416